MIAEKINRPYKKVLIFFFSINLSLLLLIPFSAIAQGEKTPLSPVETISYDLVIVGATPGGISCAVRAAREGLQVLLVERTRHIGGFISSGGGGWEAPYDGFRSPIYTEIREKITRYYNGKYGEGSPQYLASMPSATGNRHIDRAKVEPKVAELLFNKMIKAEGNLTLLTGFYPISAKRDGKILKSIGVKEFDGEKSVNIVGNIFADCTYEGDLAALAGVPYQVGREARAKYGEPHAGVLFTKNCVDKDSEQRFSTDAVEGRINIRTFPGLMCKEEVLPESTGEGDNIVMAYNYRMILTSERNNQTPIGKPESYDPSQFEGFDGGRVVPGIQNQKVGYNAGRIVGPQVGYPEGNWAIRDSISKVYLNYTLQQLYYLQNDAPEEIRQRWKKYGLAKDEFADNNNIPYEIYVREARRIVGRYIFTEHDNIPQNIERSKIHVDAIAITDWPIDLVASTTRVVPDGNMDGIVFLAESSRPAQVPYRCLLPQGLDNLLVPVCMSASHVGWGSIRLEPVWIQTGEAAGFAAALSQKLNTTPGQLNSDVLLRKLVENGAELTLLNDAGVVSGEPWVGAVQYFGTKGFFRGYNALPKEKLDKETASVWVTIFGKLINGIGYDPTLEAEKLSEIGHTEFPCLSVAKFAAQLKKTGKFSEAEINKTIISLPSIQMKDGSITRANACLVMYQLLRNK